jgi:hypothetical protein
MAQLLICDWCGRDFDFDRRGLAFVPCRPGAGFFVGRCSDEFYRKDFCSEKCLREWFDANGLKIIGRVGGQMAEGEDYSGGLPGNPEILVGA